MSSKTWRDSEEHIVSSEQDIVVGLCECGNEPSGNTKSGEFVKHLSQYQAIKGQSFKWQLRVYTGKKNYNLEIFIFGKPVISLYYVQFQHKIFHSRQCTRKTLRNFVPRLGSVNFSNNLKPTCQKLLTYFV
jgi:hypothetical protein